MFWNPNNPKNKLKEKHEVVVSQVVIQHKRQNNWKKTQITTIIISTFTYNICGQQANVSTNCP